MVFSKRTTRRRFFFWIVAVLWAAGLLWNPEKHPLFVDAQQPEAECTPAEVQYEWQRWNYYELLGISRPSELTTSIDTKSVRKAYRQQAQKWHPDKQAPAQNTTTTTTGISKDEATARFAQISQAYEVMSDDWKRKEYDLFLQYCDSQAEEEQDEAALRKKRKHWSKIFSNFNFGDPLRVFEELIFGKEDDDEGDEEDSWFFDMPPRSGNPIRISKQQDEFQDALGQEQIVRLSQTEEYAPDGAGRYYYRIVSQDFLKELDPYTGNIALQPLTRPYQREEGYRNAKPAEEEIPRQSLLFPGDILTPKSALLVSPNRRYYAGLSPDCELIVMADNVFGEDTVVWSSPSPFSSSNQPPDHPHQYQQEYCFAALRGPHLVVALGKPETPRRILWYSEASEENIEDDTPPYGSHDSSSYYSAPSSYLAQLDNDGSLVVYKVWSTSPSYQELPLSTRTWMTTRNFVNGATRDDQFESLLLGSSSSPYLSTTSATYKRCMYATGPSGCYRLARRLHQLSLEIYFRLKSIMGKMDAMFDTWMDLILEEDNYLQALKQSTSGIGSQLVNKSARLVRKVLEFILLRAQKS
jgi:curved DNA-binding protein CbpA